MSEGSWDENPRPKYEDGTPSHSKFITQVFEEYDILKGEFPITTLRNTAIKTGIKEILWIYQKQTSSLDVAREMGINWWEEWNIGDNSIGQRYGALVAGYINKVQSLALQMMVAGHCGYKVGKFCHLVQNLHIYDRHFDGVSELLNKEPLDTQPKLILKENKNFYDYTIDDFEITGIDGITKINSKLELAI
jgi:thymidylate synthase